MRNVNEKCSAQINISFLAEQFIPSLKATYYETQTGTLYNTACVFKLHKLNLIQLGPNHRNRRAITSTFLLLWSQPEEMRSITASERFLAAFLFYIK